MSVPHQQQILQQNYYILYEKDSPGFTTIQQIINLTRMGLQEFGELKIKQSL